MALNLAGSINGNDLFNSVRLNRIIQTLAMQLDLARPLVYLSRLPMVNADPTELVGRFTGRILAADLIMDDQKAVVQEGGKIELSNYDVPNIKIGNHMGQKDMNRLAAFERRGVTTGADEFLDWTTRTAQNLLAGVRMRMNYLAVSMMLDTFSYNRLGVQSTGNWNKPAGLKPAAYSDWAVPSTGTPINDVRTLRQVGLDTYGITYNRLTMSTRALRYALQTDEFKAAATRALGFAADPGAVAGLPDARQREVFGQLAECEIVLDDAVFQEKANAGTFTSTRYLPMYKVIMDRTENDNNGQVWDFANTTVTETQMQTIRDLLPDVPADAPGPIAYYTASSHDANPPGQNAWAVARAFPRQFIPEASAVLTAGTFTS
jgi:hypothetical protein